jgi:large subunit ribosomal protein L30
VPRKAKGKPLAVKPKAKKPASRKKRDAQSGPKLVVRQVKSGIGHAATYRRTLAALGLRHHQAEIVVNDNPSIRGMLIKVHHLVTIRPQESK